MPLAKLHVLEGQYDEVRLGKVSSAVQNGLISALGIPPEDFFQIIHVLPKSQFRHTPSFLGLKYSDDLIVLEITFISGRPKEKRLGLLKALNDEVVAAAGISPDDLLITLYETPARTSPSAAGWLNGPMSRTKRQRLRLLPEAEKTSPSAVHHRRHRHDGICCPPNRSRCPTQRETQADRLPPRRNRDSNAGCRAASARGAVPVA